MTLTCHQPKLQHFGSSSRLNNLLLMCVSLVLGFAWWPVTYKFFMLSQDARNTAWYTLDEDQELWGILGYNASRWQRLARCYQDNMRAVDESACSDISYLQIGSECSYAAASSYGWQRCKRRTQDNAGPVNAHKSKTTTSSNFVVNSFSRFPRMMVNLSDPVALCPTLSDWLPDVNSRITLNIMYEMESKVFCLKDASPGSGRGLLAAYPHLLGRAPPHET